MKVSRRDFLKLIGATALLSSLDWSTMVRRAFAEVQGGTISLVWFESQDCAGDTTALIQATDPDLLQVLGGLTQLTAPGAVILPYHETVMPEWGAPAVAHLLLAISGVYDPFVLVIEGGIAPDEALGVPKADNICYVADVETVNQALEKLTAVVEGKIPADKVLPVIDIVKALNPDLAKALLERAKAKAPELERSVKDCLRGLSGEDVISCARWISCLMRRAVAVVTAGNCASYGGVRGNTVAFSFAGNSDLVDLLKRHGFTEFEVWSKKGWAHAPAGATGFFPDPVRGYKGFAKIAAESGVEPYASAARPYAAFIDRKCTPSKPDPNAACKPAIAVPGCPANGNAILRTLANIILWARGVLPLPELDEYWRPKFIFGATVHEQCPRAAWYAAGVMRKYPGEPSAACLFSVGCKGPASNCPWNKVGWVNGVGGPTRTGGVCIGCTMPGFMDAYEPFYKPLPAPAAPPATATVVGSIVGAAVVGAAAAYGIKKLSEKGK